MLRCLRHVIPRLLVYVILGHLVYVILSETKDLSVPKAPST